MGQVDTTTVAQVSIALGASLRMNVDLVAPAALGGGAEGFLLGTSVPLQEKDIAAYQGFC